MADRVLYIGTWEGLYEARPGADAYHTRLIGLQSPPGPRDLWNHHRGVNPAGKGAVRCPVVVDRDDPDRLYAGTNRAGIFVSEDAGTTWREVNQGLVYKEVWSLAQHPVTGDLFVGTGPSALFKSTDRGESWIECQQLRFLPTTKSWTFPGPPHISHIRHIGWHADVPDVIYGSVEEGGVLRSRDRGVTWEQLDERHGIYTDVHTVNVMADDPRTLIATTGKGAYRSFDTGDSWQLSCEGLGDRRYLAQLVVHPSRPDVLFTAASAANPSNWPNGADTAFFRSDDRGASWRRLEGGVPAYLAAGVRTVAGDPSNADAVFVGMTDGTVWMTEDGGASFHLAVRDLPQVTSIQVTHR